MSVLLSNGSALEFFKLMNLGLKKRHPHGILIAEDSTNLLRKVKTRKIRTDFVTF